MTNSGQREGFVSTWIRAGALTAVVDGLFSSVLSAVFYGSTVTRLFQGVAATLIGPKALEGGRPTALLGVLMHVGVAFWWSAVFGLIVARSAWVRRLLASPAGVITAASVYGPAVWVVMSLAVIPSVGAPADGDRVSMVGAVLWTRPFCRRTDRVVLRPRRSTMTGEETYRAAVADEMRLINSAWMGGRVDEMEASIHPDIVMALPGVASRVQGRDALLAGFRDFCNNAAVHEFHDRDMQIDIAGRTAVVTTQYEMVYERSGARYRATGRDLWVFERHGDSCIAVWRTMLDMQENAA